MLASDRLDREVAWAVKRAGRSPDQVKGEVAALERFVDRAWAAHFPVRQGYITLTESLGGPVEGVRLRVMRGDFRARLELRCDYQRARGDDQAIAILVQSAAHSDELAQIEAQGARRLRRFRWLGAGLGLALFAFIFWPIFASMGPAALPLIFGFVVLGIMPIGGVVFGGYVAERINAGRLARRLAASVGDDALQTDFRRWRALARQLGVARRSIARGSRGGPFRIEALAAGES